MSATLQKCWHVMVTLEFDSVLAVKIGRSAVQCKAICGESFCEDAPTWQIPSKWLVT